MSLALQVHDLVEWQVETFGPVTLSEQDRELVKSLREPRGRVIIDELGTAVRVQARSWVGVVHLSGLHFRIQPKLAGGIPGLLKLLLFAGGLGALTRRIDRQWFEPRQDADVLDLLALLLTIACDEIVDAGILHDYVEEEADLPVLRGRLLVDRQVQQRMGRIDRLECRYDERSSDILENQILSAALSACAARVSDPPVLASVHRLHSLFSTVCTVTEFEPYSAFDRLVYDRLNQHYQHAHELARFILNGFGLDDPLAVGELRSFAFLIDMNLLFERFVRRFVEWVLKGLPYRVRYQHHEPSIVRLAGEPYQRVVPDLLITSRAPGRCRLPVDAKYKNYDEQSHRLNPGDIYQTFLYAFAFNSRGSEVPKSVLVYPAGRPGTHPFELEIVNTAGLRGACIQVAGIYVSDALAEAIDNLDGPESRALRTVLRGSL